MAKKTELILAVRTGGLPEHINKTGFKKGSYLQTKAALQNAGLFLGPRYLLEGMEDFKQIIPYNVVTRDGGIVMYKRTPQGGEQRLHGLVSIGVGGHVDMEDVKTISQVPSEIDLYKTIRNSSFRELGEELGSDTTQGPVAIGGLLVNNEDAVGRVHIGVVSLWTLKRPLEECVPEDTLEKLELVDPTYLLMQAEAEGGPQLEPWTKILLESGWLNDVL